MFNFPALLAFSLLAVTIASPINVRRLPVDGDNTSWHIGARTAPTPVAIDDSNTAWTIKIPDAAPSPAAARAIDLDSDNTSWHIGARTAPTPAAIDNSNTAWTIKIPDAAPSPAAASDIITQARAIDLDSDNTSWHIGARTAPTPAVPSSELDGINFFWTIEIPRSVPTPGVAPPIARSVDGDNTSWHIGERTVPTPAVSPPAVDDGNTAWTIKIPNAVPTPEVISGISMQSVHTYPANPQARAIVDDNVEARVFRHTDFTIFSPPAAAPPIVDGDNTSWHIGARTVPTPAVTPPAIDDTNSGWTIKIPRSVPTPAVAPPIVDGDNTSWHIGARTIPTPPVDSDPRAIPTPPVDADNDRWTIGSLAPFRMWYIDGDNTSWHIGSRTAPTPAAIDADNDHWTIGIPRAVPTPDVIDGDNTSWYIGPRTAPTPAAIDADNDHWTIGIPRAVPTPDVSPMAQPFINQALTGLYLFQA
ncbi:hypothetical protein B0H13DRAFT_2304368 [Mycena leptocephala]|nr:hypothetical protein B0H13DRAFT_2304368 [Mycena leptocephala]